MKYSKKDINKSETLIEKKSIIMKKFIHILESVNNKLKI